MRKRNLIFPLVVSSLFMPSIEALDRTTDLNSFENENNIYEAVDILIAEKGGSGGGGLSPAEQEERDKKRKAAQDAAKKRINSKIQEQKIKSDTIDPKASFQEWADQLIEIKDNIAALEQFLYDIQVFIDYSIKKYDEISSEYNDGNLSFAGQVMLLEYVGEFKKISKRSKELGLTTNDEIKNLLKSLDSDFGEFAESLLN